MNFCLAQALRTVYETRPWYYFTCQTSLMVDPCLIACEYEKTDVLLAYLLALELAF